MLVMPRVKIVLYKDDDGTIPVVEFVKTVPEKQREKILARLELLEQKGHELRRPDADYLRDDIYELRIRYGHVNYRLLYFFHGREIAVVAAGLTKEAQIPPR